MYLSFIMATKKKKEDRVNKTIPLDAETIAKVQRMADTELCGWATIARKIFVDAVRAIK